jgi:purine-cytosine permease-like protein
MTISRFSFGWLGAIIMAFFNLAACIGWSAVNVIVGGQLVASLSEITPLTCFRFTIRALAIAILRLLACRRVHMHGLILLLSVARQCLWRISYLLESPGEVVHKQQPAQIKPAER